MNPKNRISCPGIWAIMHDEQNDVGDVVEFFYDEALKEFCYVRNTGLANKVIPESQLTNLTAWCLVDRSWVDRHSNMNSKTRYGIYHRVQ